MLLFFDGMKHTTSSQFYSKWDGAGTSGTIFFNFSGGRFGGRYVRFNNAYVYKNVIDSDALVIGFGWKPEPYSFGGSTTASLLRLFNNGTANVWLNYAASSASHVLSINTTAGILATSTTAFSTSNWYWVELKVVAKSDATGYIELRINGAVEFIVNSVITETTGLNKFNKISLGYSSNSSYGNIDDMYVANTVDDSGVIDFLGPISIATLYPNNTGYYSNFTVIGGGANYDAINTTPADTVKYLQSAVVNQRESHRYTDIGVAVNKIYGVAHTIYATKPSAGSRCTELFIRGGGTDYDSGVDIPINGDWRMLQRLYKKSPVTNLEWATNEITTIEPGMKVRP